MQVRFEFDVTELKPGNARGAGAKADLINYGMRNANGKLIAVLRVGCAPYGNARAIEAVRKDLAQHTAYLMRLAGVGLSADHLIDFVQASTLRFRADMLALNLERERKGLPPRDYRYLLSLVGELSETKRRFVREVVRGILVQESSQ